jgi:predicted RNA-binding protein with PIN domain
MPEPPVEPPRVPARPATREAAERRPVALPGGLRDDSVEAARHLISVPGMTLLVDGYNVSMRAWADADLTDQRRRLTGRLDALASRTAVEPIVVFDGDHGHAPVSGRPRQQVRVRFSAPGVEADDEILELVETLPPAVPVTVVSSDRRVMDGARDRGANVITSAQLHQLF